MVDRKSISKSTASTHHHHICPVTFPWRTGEALCTSQSQFQTHSLCCWWMSLPHCKNHTTAYYNRKLSCSVILTRFCDRWRNARAFRNTDVAQLLEEDPQALIPEGMHIIGNSVYPLLRQVTVPCRDKWHLTVRQEHLNRNTYCSLCGHWGCFSKFNPSSRVCTLKNWQIWVQQTQHVDQLDKDEQGLHHLREGTDDPRQPQPNNQDASHYRCP